jgi:predicted transposase YdaD
LKVYQPRLTYHLIDEARLKLHPADTVRTAIEALFRLERGRTLEDTRRVVRALLVLLNDPAQDRIRRTFAVWIKHLLRRKAGTSNIAEIESINDLLEVDTMLAERIESWFDEATQKGLQQGLEKGREEGREEGLLKGEAKILSKQLRLRFGPLPPETVERLAQATEIELEAWGEAILSAPSLAAVFETPRH